MSQDRNNHHRADGGAAEEEEEDHYLVSCRCESAKILSTLLCCLDNISGSSSISSSSFNTDEAKQARRKASSTTLQPVTVYVTAKGLSFHVYGKAKQIQSSFDMHHSMFMEYHIASMPDDNNNNHNNTGGGSGGKATPEDWQAGGEFCVNLSTVLECLHLLGTHHLERTKVSFSYETRKEIFKLEMIDEFSTYTVAAIPGMMIDEGDAGNALPLAFRSSTVTARIIIQSETLHAVLSELDLVVGATRVTLSLARSTGLRFTVKGSLGNNCTIRVPIAGNHIVSVELPSIRDEATTPTKHDYPLQVFMDSMRGLDIAEETCITMNTAGMVAIQHIVFDKTISEEPCFVDCIICSLCNDDNDDDEEDEATTTTAPYAVPSPQSVAVSTRSLESQAPINTKKSKVTQLEEEEDDDNDDQEEQHSALLFGSVVENSNASRASSTTNRNVRRRTRRRNVEGDSDDDDDDDGSRNMLLDPPINREASFSDDSDSEMETAASRTPIAAKRTGTTRHEDCPSPELLYGHQHPY